MSRAVKTILGIETSCDETAVAVVECAGGIKNPRFKIRANVVSSQIKLHAPFGGVVPNIAKREHIKNLPLVLERALRKARISSPAKELSAIAVTVGPGLEPALWAGINFAQKLAVEWKIPVIPANHMEGHLVTPLLSDKWKVTSDKSKKSKKSVHSPLTTVHFPAIALLVSGGHTELVLVRGWGKYKVIGETLDDAAGEAFDKVARMLELGYPGGPEIARLARTGNRYFYSFPRPMINTKNYDFSFSGLKTAVLYKLRDLKASKTPFSKNDIAASFQDAVVDVLLTKTFRAAREYRAKSVIVGGGVAANNLLRTRFRQSFGKEKLFLSPIAFTGDNAAMIGAAAYFHALKKDYTSWKKLAAHATLPL